MNTSRGDLCCIFSHSLFSNNLSQWIWPGLGIERTPKFKRNDHKIWIKILLLFFISNLLPCGLRIVNFTNSGFNCAVSSSICSQDTIKTVWRLVLVLVVYAFLSSQLGGTVIFSSRTFLKLNPPNVGKRLPSPPTWLVHQPLPLGRKRSFTGRWRGSQGRGAGKYSGPEYSGIKRNRQNRNI